MKGVFERYKYDISSGIEAIFDNRIKSFLTALGIIFGVAAVITMLAIGNGAEQEILEQIKLVGVNNIIISPTENIVDPNATATSDNQQQISIKKYSKGLTLLDAESIEEVVPRISKVCPVITFNYSAILNGKSKPVVLEGINNHYFDLFNISLLKGDKFTSSQTEQGFPVCIIGNNINNVFFNHEDAVGKYIKCGQV